MKIFVTGATGFVGSHIADKLFTLGHEIRCTIRSSSNLRWLTGKPFELVQCSLFDKEALKEAVSGVDYIFHAAGLTSAKNLNEFMQGNCEGTMNLIQAATQNASNLKRFLYISSQAAAGPSESKENPKTESMPDNPITSYGISKKAAEEVVMSFSNQIPVTIVRPSAVYGPRDTEIFQIFKSVKMGLGTIVGFNKKYLNLVHSEDVARGAVEAAFSGQTTGKKYFLSSEEFYSWDFLIDTIKRGLGKKYVLKLKLPHFVVLGAGAISGAIGKFSDKPPVFNYEKSIDFIQNYWTCSVEKAKQDFGYRQKISAVQGITDTIRWYRDNHWL
ncbi:MAG: NAD-dependent epimerase [Ignavibacteria bacterium]|nr:NAD-dependent epimerase [Ignavibacteria bacterium]